MSSASVVSKCHQQVSSVSVVCQWSPENEDVGWLGIRVPWSRADSLVEGSETWGRWWFGWGDSGVHHRWHRSSWATPIRQDVYHSCYCCSVIEMVIILVSAFGRLNQRECMCQRIVNSVALKANYFVVVVLRCVRLKGYLESLWRSK